MLEYDPDSEVRRKRYLVSVFNETTRDLGDLIVDATNAAIQHRMAELKDKVAFEDWYSKDTAHRLSDMSSALRDRVFDDIWLKITEMVSSAYTSLATVDMPSGESSE